MLSRLEGSEDKVAVRVNVITKVTSLTEFITFEQINWLVGKIYHFIAKKRH